MITGAARAGVNVPKIAAAYIGSGREDDAGHVVTVVV